MDLPEEIKNEMDELEKMLDQAMLGFENEEIDKSEFRRLFK